MTLDKLKKWAEDSVGESDANGPKIETDTTFTDTVIGEGFTSERLPYPRLNKIINRSDSKLNEAIERLPKAIADDSGELPYIQGLFTPSNDFSNVGSDLNVFDISADIDDILDFCFCVIHGDKNLLVVEDSAADDDPIKIFNIETGTVTGCGDLSSHLSTPTTDWTAISICCDETYCYVVFRDTGPSPDDHRVQSFALADWSVNSGWPSSGLALTAGSVAYDDEQARIRNATDSKLVVTQPWVAVSSGASAGLNIISKADGTSDGTGAGNVGTVSNGQVSGVCSDGTTVFFSVELTSSVLICGMTVASPGANGPSGTHWPWTASVDPDEFGGIACSGNIIVATWADGSMIFSVHGTTYGAMSKYSTGDTEKCQKLGPVCFDGKCFWALGLRVINGVEERVHLFRLTGAARGGISESSVEDVTDGELFIESHIAITGISTSYSISGYKAGVILSDGRDVWFFGNLGEGKQTLYRQPRTLIR